MAPVSGGLLYKHAKESSSSGGSPHELFANSPYAIVYHMSTSTKVTHGLVTDIEVPVKILKIKGVPGEVHYNPGLARDDKGRLWISLRSCIYNPKRWEGWEHPMHWQNYVNVGFLNEKTLEISELKELKPAAEYEGFQWGLEDARLFWRPDGMHAIGVILPIRNGDYRTCQAEVIMNHKEGTYTLVKDYGRPKGANIPEKNWSPAESATDKFDFVYSTTEVVKDGAVIGEDNHLAIHNGSKLLPYEDGYIQLCHVIAGIDFEKTYATIAVKRDARGYGTHVSQLFHLNVGWREHLKETIEFVSDMVWVAGKEGSELLVALGVKDEATGIARIPVDKFIWDDTVDIMWYNWRWATPPNRDEIATDTSARPDWHPQSSAPTPE